MTKKYQVNFTEQSQNDLERIFYYIAADSFNNAMNFVIELEEKVYSLETFPNRHPLIRENEFFGTDYRHLIYKKYRIVCRIIDNSVFILRIIHGTTLLKV